MAQYYSSLFQSGLARESTLPPTAGPSKPASHQTSSSATTTATALDASMRFMFGDNGSLRAHAKSSSVDQSRSGGHASFLSMNSSEKRSMVTSATSSAQRRQVTAPSRPVQSPPSPALSTHSTQSHLMRSPPSPVPAAPLKTSSSIRRANVTSEMPSEASTMRSLSSASSIYRRTNRSRALAALEGRPEMKRDALKAVPESRSFVPFDDSDDEGQSGSGGFKRFVERTRAAAVREKEERERARREAEERERVERSAQPATVAAAKPPMPAQRSAPGSTPAYSYNQNFIDLDDDGSNSSGRSRSTRSHSMAGLSLSSGGSSSKNPANGPVAGSSRAAQRPEWHSSVMHVASAA